jgi:hypothetical protein
MGGLTSLGKSRLGPLGIAIAVLVVVSIILAALFCAFPWEMTKRFTLG